jgi:hypothetical protein
MKRLILLFLLVSPLVTMAQTSVTGRVLVGLAAARPTTCSPSDLYATTDTFALFECGPANTWTAFNQGSSGFPNQNANLVFAGPSSGGPAAPTFRAEVVADLPTSGTWPFAGTLSGAFASTGASTYTKINGIIWCDGVTYSTLNAAVAALSAPGTVAVAPGFACPVTVNTTIPANVQLMVYGAPQIAISNAVTLTFANGASLNAPWNQQVFSYTGTGTVAGLNGHVSASWFPGADYGIQVNNATAACNLASFIGCTVHIAGQSQTQTTTINYPFVTGGTGNYNLIWDEGAILNYTGSGYSVDATPGALGQINRANIHITNPHIDGTVAGKAGIHCTGPTDKFVIDGGGDIENFTAKTGAFLGAGVWNEGCVTGTILGLQVAGNGVGYHGDCIVQFAATTCASGIVWTGGHIQSNLTWGIWEDPGTQFGLTTGSNAGNFYETVIEGNATTNPVTNTNISCTLTTNVVVCTVTGHPYTVGMLMFQSAFSIGTCFNGRFTITSTTTNTYSYKCTSGNGTATGGTVTGQSGQVFVQMGSSISIRNGFLQFGSAPSGFAASTYIGDSSNVPIGTTIRDSFYSSVGATSTIDNFNGNGTLIEGNYEFNAVTNFYNHGAAAIKTTLGRNSSVATNYLGGTLDGASTSLDTNGNYFVGGTMSGGLKPTGSTNGDVGASRATNSGFYYYGSNGSCYLGLFAAATGLTPASACNSFISATANPSGTGFIKLASGDSIGWRNNANGADVLLAKNASDQFTFGGTIAPSTAGSFDVGAALLPWGNLWIGTAATNNFKFQPGATAAARVISMIDPLVATTLPLVDTTSTTATNFLAATTTAGRYTTRAFAPATDCATCTTNASALTSNAVVLGNGGQAAKTATFLTTDGAATLTVGVAAGGNGVLALSGNTSGTATFTAPAVAGTRSNNVVSTNGMQIPAITVTNLLLNSTAPTIAAGGCGGAAASIPSNNGTAAFTINTGTTPTAGGCTITMPAATTGWICNANHVSAITTTNFVIQQTGAASTTSVTLQDFSDVAAASAPAASVVWRVGCFAY